MKKFTYAAGFLVVISFIFITFTTLTYKYKIGPVSKNSDIKEFVVSEGDTYLTLAKKLKDSNLIKSEGFYKIYIRLMKPSKLEAGKYELSENMGVDKIVKQFENGSDYNPNVVKVTIPEGKHIEEVANIISKATNNSKEELLKFWNSDEFVDKVIDTYWFITDDIKNDEIRYKLEGYFFPDTYNLLNKDVTPQYIAFKMLDKMSVVLNGYKDSIEKSDYSIHQILTMASIVEYEAILDDDRPIIAGVFYNRLDLFMPLGSCATIGYALNNFKLTYTDADLKVDSPYNTYKYTGLPIGPGGMPGIKSIEAAILPATTDYLYFMANVCDVNNKKTDFSKTYDEHVAKTKKYLTCY